MDESKQVVIDSSAANPPVAVLPQGGKALGANVYLKELPSVDESDPGSFFKTITGVDFELFAYEIAVLVPQIEEKTKGGVYLTGSMIEDQQKAENIGMVLGFGPQSFTPPHDSRKCNEGDWILYSTMERVLFFPGNQRVYIVRDDKIIGRFKTQQDAANSLHMRKGGVFG